MTASNKMGQDELRTWCDDLHKKLETLFEHEPDHELNCFLQLFQPDAEKEPEYKAMETKFNDMFPKDPDLPDDQIVSLMAKVEDALASLSESTMEPSVTAPELVEA